MKHYCVELCEDNCIFMFECMADDADHAIEQALNAYPDAELEERVGESNYSFMTHELGYDDAYYGG